jgi:hypothetical protein
VIYTEIFKKHLICLTSQLECQLEKMDSTRSLIQWTNSCPDKDSYHGGPIINYVGRVKGCDLIVNIYGHTGYWNWTIRSRSLMRNLIVGGNYFKTLRNAKKHATKWAIVQFLRQINPNFCRSYNGKNSVRWFQSL